MSCCYQTAQTEQYWTIMIHAATSVLMINFIGAYLRTYFSVLLYLLYTLSIALRSFVMSHVVSMSCAMLLVSVERDNDSRKVMDVPTSEHPTTRVEQCSEDRG